MRHFREHFALGIGPTPAALPGFGLLIAFRTLTFIADLLQRHHQVLVMPPVLPGVVGARDENHHQHESNDELQRGAGEEFGNSCRMNGGKKDRITHDFPHHAVR